MNCLSWHVCRKCESMKLVFVYKRDSSDESTDAFVPGVSLPGNRRPSRLRARKTREINATIPKKQPHVEMLSDSVSAYSKTSSLSSTKDYSFAERSIRQLKKASLKDLRPEDKKRIADLIKELARVGEEKEKAVYQLHGERENFEKQLLTLVDQQEKILHEREDVQEKLFQCQQLLTEYQAQILNKQDKLNSSIANLKLAIDDPSETSDSPTSLPARRLSFSTPVSEIEFVTPKWLNNQDIQDKKKDISPANYEAQYKLSANQNEEENDILTETKDPAEGLKRPYTSLIDKEIARERSLSRSSKGSRSRSVSPGDGRPRFSYPEKLTGIGPLHEPVASSTHKSVEIRAQMSNHLDPDSPRSSIRGSSVKGQSPVEFERQARSHVAFNDRTETSEGAKLHSPNLRKGQIFKDPEYMEYYKQLTSSGRKKELLKQRQSLLDEQDRLRAVLKEQENQLKRKQLEYEKRQQLQKERMEFYEKGDKFPPLKLNFDAENYQEVEENAETPGIVLQRVGKESDIGMAKHTPSPQDVEIDDTVEIKSRVSAATSPFRPSQQEKVSMATSPLHTPRSQRSERSHESDDESGPKLIDVATSISYRSPLKDAGNRQGNLPLHSNRQRSSPALKELPITSPRNDPLTSSRTPGEKTLNVLDIVNSMEDCSAPVHNSYIENRENNFEPVAITPDRKRTSLGSRAENKSSQNRMRHSPAIYRQKQPIKSNEDEESLEESRILEDIFFL